MSFYNQDIRFVLPSEIEVYLAACLKKLIAAKKLATCYGHLPVLDEGNKKRQACDHCMSLGITPSDPLCVHEIGSIFIKCALNIRAIAASIHEYRRTIDNMSYLMKMYRLWHISMEPIDNAENELCAAKKAFDEMLDATVERMSGIFQFLEAEKKALVEKGCTREACSVQYEPATDKDAEIFFAFKDFFKLFASFA